MKSAITLLIALAGIALCQAADAQACTPLASSTAAQARASVTRESATVEDVVSIVQEGYRSQAYIVTWHGSRVLVSDPLADSNRSVGDSIDFIAIRNEVNGDRILNFISTVRAPHPPAPHPAAGAARFPDVQASATTGSGVIEDVLSAQDNGFRFIAYIVRLQDQRIAVSDPLALSHHAIGEQIDYLASRATLPGRSLLSFQVQLTAAEKGSLSGSLCGIQRSEETGVVDQVLCAAADGYAYHAYVVEWRGAQIVIDDPAAATDYRPGDSVSFWLSRMQLPPPLSRNSQQFSFERPVQTSTVNPAADFQTSIAMDSAPVQSVLDSTVDGYRSVAYLIEWHGAAVAVADAFATTHFAAGDRIRFSVARTADTNHKELRFMLFNFPPPPCKAPSASDTTPSAATVTPATVACHS